MGCNPLRELDRNTSSCGMATPVPVGRIPAIVAIVYVAMTATRHFSPNSMLILSPRRYELLTK